MARRKNCTCIAILRAYNLVVLWWEYIPNSKVLEITYCFYVFLFKNHIFYNVIVLCHFTRWHFFCHLSANLIAPNQSTMDSTICKLHVGEHTLWRVCLSWAIHYTSKGTTSFLSDRTQQLQNPALPLEPVYSDCKANAYARRSTHPLKSVPIVGLHFVGRGATALDG